MRRKVNNQKDLTQRFDIMEIILEKMQSASDFSVATNNSSIPITDVTSSYSLPLDNLQDLEIFEKHISEDGTFRNSLVSYYIIIFNSKIKINSELFNLYAFLLYIGKSTILFRR